MKLLPKINVKEDTHVKITSKRFFFLADELYQLHMEVGIDVRGHLNQVGVRLVALNLTPSFI